MFAIQEEKKTVLRKKRMKEATESAHKDTNVSGKNETVVASVGLVTYDL